MLALAGREGELVNAEVTRAETRLVEEWVRPAIGPEVAVRFGVVDEPDAGDETTVVMTLLELVPSPAVRRASGPAPLHLRARYLVTVQGFSPTEGAQCLAELAFGAAAVTQLELEPAPPGPATWSGLGARARPALIASVLLERERAQRRVPRVREPLITQWSPIGPLVGVVIGPRDIPIAGALVELDGSSATTYTNHRGEFSFRTVPTGDPPPNLVVTAKGTHLRVRVPRHTGPDKPFLIRVPIPES